MKARFGMSALLITLGFIVADAAPGRLSTFYAEVLGPLLAGTWLAMAFRGWWRSHKEAVLSWSGPRLRGLLMIAVLVLLLGGFRLVWVDPWLFLPMAWPLVEIGNVLRRRSEATRPS